MAVHACQCPTGMCQGLLNWGAACDEVACACDTIAHAHVSARGDLMARAYGSHCVECGLVEGASVAAVQV